MNANETPSLAILRLLWDGCATPSDDSLFGDPQIQELLDIALAQKDHLFDDLTEEQRALLNKAEEDRTLCAAVTHAAVFRYAFKLGAWMMMETLSDKKNL